MEKELIRVFGKTLKTLRNNVGISQEELAFRANLDRTYISMLERGVRQPTLITMLHLAHVLGVSVISLLKDTERAWVMKNRSLRVAEPRHHIKSSTKRR